MTIIADYVKTLNELSREHTLALQAARSFTDPNLSQEGLAAKRAEMIVDSGRQLKSKLERVRSDFAIDRNYVESRAKRALPKPPESTRDDWERVRMLLDSGQPLAMVIAKASPGQLQAIREWVPTWLDARSQGKSTDLSGFERSISKRWSEVAPDGQPIRNLLEAAPHIAQFEVFAKDLDGRIEGGHAGSLRSSIEAELAFQEATVTLETSGEDAA